MEKILSLPEWRCTRRSPYHPGCAGHTDLSAREGHYIRAATAEEAKQEMRKRWPADVDGFDVQLWKPALPVIA
jgi:hypothetical protein